MKDGRFHVPPGKLAWMEAAAGVGTPLQPLTVSVPAGRAAAEGVPMQPGHRWVSVTELSAKEGHVEALSATPCTHVGRLPWWMDLRRSSVGGSFWGS